MQPAIIDNRSRLPRGADGGAPDRSATRARAATTNKPGTAVAPLCQHGRFTTTGGEAIRCDVAGRPPAIAAEGLPLQEAPSVRVPASRRAAQRRRPVQLEHLLLQNGAA